MDIKVTSIFAILLGLLLAQTADAWEVDMSHHKSPQLEEQVPPAPVMKDQASDEHKDLGGFVVKSKHHTQENSKVDRQEVVILNTENGFVPANVRLHKGLHYVIHIVNVNEQKKNVSFIMDAFNQHHATYYGQIRTFNVDPDHEGIFEYECPETTALGKLVVYGETSTKLERNISSEDNSRGEK